MSKIPLTGRCAYPAFAALAVCLLPTAGLTQCTTNWVPGAAVPGTTHTVQAMTVHDPDGPGPLPPLLLVAGQFAVAGSAIVGGLAAFDPVTGSWSQFAGSVTGGGIRALLSLPNGDLIAGGAFWTIGGVAAGAIARWDGTAWSPMGGVTIGVVNDLALLPNGDIVAGGAFGLIGGTTAGRVARWDGSQWHPMSLGFSTHEVHALAVRPNGNVIAGGTIATYNNIAEWNGTGWNAIGSSLWLQAESVRSIVVLPNSDVVAGGRFALMGGPATNIARYNGATWSTLGSGLNAQVEDLAVHQNGDIYAGGHFEFQLAGGPLLNRAARWDGTTWNALGTGIGEYTVTKMVLWPNGNLFVGGLFETAGGVTAKNVAGWNGNGWSPLAIGTSASIASIQPHGGDLIVAGAFATIEGVAANNIARFDGTIWSPLGSGTDGQVYTTLTLPNGDLVAGGNFTTAGGVAVSNIAIWDGATWQGIPGANFMAVSALAVHPSGDLLIAAWNGFGDSVVRWDGTGFTILTGLHGHVRGLAALQNGDVVACGYLGGPGALGSGVSLWDGTAWSSIGQAIGLLPNDLSDLIVLPNGDFVVGGDFFSINGVNANSVALWNGSTWHALGLGTLGRVNALSALPNGDLVVTGGFGTAGGGTTANHIARWDGVAWNAMGSGLDRLGTALSVLRNGELIVGGDFSIAGGQVSANIARWQPSCPATEVSIGAACASTGGPMDLQFTTLPWIGGSMAAQCTGMAPNAIGAAIIGLTSPNTPLNTLHPTGVVNCALLASPDATLLLFPAAGAAGFSAPISGNPVFVGLQLNTQILQLELSVQGSALALSASNAVRVTIGTY